MISTLGIPTDVPAEKCDLYSTLDMYANTAKPLVLLISGEKKINEVYELLSLLHGDISTKPFFLFYVNPITPLVMNKSTTDKMIYSIRNKIPLIYSNYSMYGGTSPIIPASSLALLNAELLAGLVFSQIIEEGSKIILGSLPAAFNMTNMGSIYTPISYLLNLACAEMMSYYKIPHCGTSGSGIGRGADIQACGDLWLNHLISCIGKIGCAPFVGGNFDSTTFSPTTVVLSDHVIGKAKEFAKGFSISDELVNLNEINRIGHGGNYFTSDQTLKFINESRPLNDIWTSLSLEEWQNRNMISPEEELIKYTFDLYSKAEKESKENIELIKEGEEFIRSIKI
jgi:trimethylamine--corrinoid protein Co-methyltransferase